MKNSLKTEDFNYDLPPDLIATHPTKKRDASRLLVLDRNKKDIEHSFFTDLSRFICKEKDLIILNKSKVIPASLSSLEGNVSLLLLEETSPNHWLALSTPSKKTRQGARIKIAPKKPSLPPLECEVLQTLPTGERVLRFFSDFSLDDYGETPLPPYILKKRKRNSETPEPNSLSSSLDSGEDESRYQTVYAQENGSVAAPTAGLHFTEELLASFDHAFVTLHIGLGTFRPIKKETIQEHPMHEERFSIEEGLEEKIFATRKRGGRVIAVGTSVARVLESIKDLKPQEGRTRLFIYPPYHFRTVDALLTNFHLPRSTLLTLVSALAGKEKIQEAYAEAIKEKYRFYSYGDAMLIL